MADGLNNFFQSLSGKLGNAIGNPQAQQKPGIPTGGPIRTPFLTPNTLLSSVYVASGTSAYQQRSTAAGVASTSPNLSTTILTNGGLNRTSTGVASTNSPGVSLPETKRTSTIITTNSVGEPVLTNTGQKRQQQPGFTPIEYYRTSTGEFRITPPKNLLTYDDRNSASINAPYQIGDDRMGDFKFKLSDYVNFISDKNNFETSDGGISDKPWEKIIDQTPFRLMNPNYVGSLSDNEDPVYFGFEVIIKVESSPIFNGEVEKFINSIGSTYDEVASRENILTGFQFEMQKYFKFNLPLNQSGGRTTDIPLPNNLKKYYVKKISGLDKLIEANTGNSRKSFIDYGKDVIKITFYEDTSLNLGRLASLYKLLYWSRLRGKSIIPENLLRFDCEIIVSELRDFVKVRKSDNMIEVLKSNLSRYRYQLYECQWWFNQMSHPADIDLSSAPTPTDIYDVEMTFKYSTMVYEQYEGGDISLRNSTVNPFAKIPSSTPDSATGFPKNREYIPLSYLDFTQPTVVLSKHDLSNLGAEVNQSTSTELTIDNLEQQSKINIYQLLTGPSPISDFQTSNNLTQESILQAQATNVANDSINNSTPKTDIYGKAAEQLVENLKDAALREAQRQLNIQFRLLNNSIDRIRNAFGIGRMTPPANVYFPKQNTGAFGNSNIFFDVQNSLRNFAGDTLTGLIGGG
jgi:hypothetical protein